MKRRILSVLIVACIIALVYCLHVRVRINDLKSHLADKWTVVETSSVERVDKLAEVLDFIENNNLACDSCKMQSLRETLKKASESNINYYEITKESLIEFRNSHRQIANELNAFIIGCNIKNDDLKKMLNSINNLNERMRIEIEDYSNSAKSFNYYIGRIRHKYVAEFVGVEKQLYFKSMTSDLAE